MIENRRETGGRAMLIVLGLIYLFSNYHRFAFAVLSEPMSRELHLSGTQLGWIGSVFFYAYACMQLPCGYLADRFGVKRVIMVSLAITGIASILSSIGGGFLDSAFYRLLLGIGVSCLYIPILSSLREWYPPESLGYFTGIIFSLGTIGTLLSSKPLSVLLDHISWRSSFLIGGAAVFVLFLVCIPVLRDTGRRETGTGKVQFQGIDVSGLICLSIWHFLTSGIKLSFQGLWAVEYLKRFQGFDLSTIATLLLLIGIGGILGGPLAGYLSDRRGVLNTMVHLSTLHCVCWAVLALLGGNTPVYLFYIYIPVLGAVSQGAIVVSYSLAGSLGSESNRGMTIGVVNSASFFGIAVFTQYFGSVIERVNDPMRSFPLLYRQFAVLLFLSILLLIGYGRLRSRRVKFNS